MFDVPNLDELTTDPKTLGEVSLVLRNLSRYADAKTAALQLRKMGSHAQAILSERECARIYDVLPIWAQWKKTKQVQYAIVVVPPESIPQPPHMPKTTWYLKSMAGLDARLTASLESAEKFDSGEVASSVALTLSAYGLKATVLVIE